MRLRKLIVTHVSLTKDRNQKTENELKIVSFTFHGLLASVFNKPSSSVTLTIRKKKKKNVHDDLKSPLAPIRLMIFRK